MLLHPLQLDLEAIFALFGRLPLLLQFPKSFRLRLGFLGLFGLLRHLGRFGCFFCYMRTLCEAHRTFCKLAGRGHYFPAGDHARS
ncbi:hypothetical protein UE98_29465 [Burkholderia cenocepacia]|nr:hypothetical protein UE98_29465 [Burkholderia cenocepacia]